jgi:hypothetical protein
MRTKQTTTVALVGAFSTILASSGFAESVAETLEQGVQLQQNDGDYDAAIERYQAVLKHESKWKKIAAEARYRLAECFLAKGDAKSARKQVKVLRDDYPADNRWVVKASNLIPAETNFGPAPWRDGHFYKWVITLKNGEKVGYFLAAEHIVEAGEDPVWESYIVRNGGAESLSRSKYHQNSHKMIDSRWFMKGMADNQTSFGKDGVVTITDSETGAVVDTHDHPKSQDGAKMLYENEQMVQLIRCLNLDIGTKQDTVLIASINNGVPIEFTMEVTGHEDVTVPAGTFSCAKVETNLKQTFFISRDDERRIVMMDFGTAKVKLSGEEAWNSLKPMQVTAEKMGSSLQLPGTVLDWVVADKKEIFRVNLWPTDFAARTGMFEVNLTKNLVEEAQAGSREFAEIILKNLGKSFDKMEAVENSWESIDVDGVEGVAVEVAGRMGEVILHEYQVFAVGEEKALSLRLDFAARDRDRARELAKEIIANFRWDG